MVKVSTDKVAGCVVVLFVGIVWMMHPIYWVDELLVDRSVEQMLAT